MSETAKPMNCKGCNALLGTQILWEDDQPFCPACMLKKLVATTDPHAVMKAAEEAVEREQKRADLNGKLAELQEARVAMGNSVAAAEAEVKRLQLALLAATNAVGDADKELLGLREDLTTIDHNIDQVNHQLARLDGIALEEKK